MTNSLFQYQKLEDESQDEKPLSIGRKLCFAVGGAPTQMVTTISSLFLTIFLLEIAEIHPNYVSIVVFVAKAWSAMSVLIVGYMVNRTETRWGKMRPWIIISAPFACVTYFFLWYVPDVSEQVKLVYYLVIFCAHEGFLSCFYVPYTSLTMYISNDQNERDSATAYRMVAEALGVFVGVAVEGKLIDQYRTAGDCREPGSTPSPRELSDQKWSYMVGAGVAVSLFMVCALTVFLGVREKDTGLTDSQDKTNFWIGLKEVLTFGPYMKSAMVFLFLFLAITMKQGNIALYVTHSLHMGHQLSSFIIVLIIMCVVSVPVWQFLLTSVGKKSSYATFFPGLVCLYFLPPRNAVLYYCFIVFAGMSIGGALLLPWSVLPDVLDLFMLETKTRKDALFYSFYVFFNKFAAGLALVVSLLALQYGGYVTGACVQPASVDETLRILVSAGPITSGIIALLFLWRFPIDEKKRKWIQEQVELVRAGVEKTEDDSEQTSKTYGSHEKTIKKQ